MVEFLWKRADPDPQIAYTFIIKGTYPCGHHVYPKEPNWDEVRAAAEEVGLDTIPDEQLPEPLPLTINDFRVAIQAHVDSTAKQRNYDSGITCASYVNSTVPAWGAEAVAFVAWRDSVWAYAYVELAKVEGGQRPQPSVETIVSELPPITWPAQQAPLSA